MSKKTRRSFITATIGLIAGTLATTSNNVLASTSKHQHAGSGNGLEIDSSKKDTCATCEHWGGMRKASKDRSSVTAQSMGWCNNPDSDNYHKLTSADHIMKKTGVWKKWSVLG